MWVEGIIKQGSYFDSATLMLISKQVSSMPGVIEAALYMGTESNVKLLEEAGMFLEEFKKAKPSDLILVVKGEDKESTSKALNEGCSLLIRKKSREEESIHKPRSISSALKAIPDLNLAIVSVSGRFAYEVTHELLEKGLNVFLFSDHVPLDEEAKLKKMAFDRRLFLMGPDAGTAIIGGVGIAFSNKIRKGSIGIVAAAGTGIQEVSSIISDYSGGISHAIGTGGRDLNIKVGGITTLMGLQFLSSDNNTEVVMLISKPPDPEVSSMIFEQAGKVKKPVVVCFLGDTIPPDLPSNLFWSESLEEAALLSLTLTRKENPTNVKDYLKKREDEISSRAFEEAKKISGKRRYLRGLFTGGTLAYEALLVLKGLIGEVYSNTPLSKEFKIQGVKSINNTIIDLGEDEFTVGRLHPIIDYTFRVNRISREIKDEDVAIIFFDLILGYGAPMEPLKEILPLIYECKGKVLPVVHICGTHEDIQNKNMIEKALEEAGALCFKSNREVSFFAGKVIRSLNVEQA